MYDYKKIHKKHEKFHISESKKIRVGFFGRQIGNPRGNPGRAPL